MDQFAGVCRLVWNLALEQRRNHWRQYRRATGNNLNYVAQARELTALRAESDFVRAVHITPLQRTLKALDNAFVQAWRGNGGYPQPKRKGVHDAFSFSGRDIAVEKVNRRWGRVRLPKIGWIKFRLTRPLQGVIREASVTRTAAGWQISIGCRIEGDLADNGQAVGVDRGVAAPLMLSDGTSFALPDHLAMASEKLRRAQRVASKRKRGSARRTKAKNRAALLYAKVARIRRHWAHETTTAITRTYSTVVVERLRTKSMTASAAGTIANPGKNVSGKRGLNRAILNIGWHQIELMLAYKSFRLIKVDPAHTSQMCSSCGAIDSRSRESQASFVCTSCGHRDNADRNAAINILNRGNAPGVELALLGGDEARTIQGALPS